MDISARSIAREFAAPKGVNMANYGANHYNDDGKSILQSIVLFFSFGRILLSENVDPNKKKQNELSSVNNAIYKELQQTKQNQYQVTLNGVVITLEEHNQKVKIIVDNNGEISTEFLEDMNFAKMQDILLGGTSINREDLKTDPAKVILQLRQPNRTLSAVPFDVLGGNVMPKVEEQICPGGHTTVKIFAGTTFHGQNGKSIREISDSATVVFFDDMCATTVVDGCDFTAKPENSRTYSAVITAAALSTVQSFKDGVIEDGDVQTYFYKTVKEFEKKAPFIQDDGLGVTFVGVVLFYDADGTMKQFTYGLGDTALASTSKQGMVTTHHLQSNFASKSVFESTIPALGPGYTRVKQEHVTAQISTVNANVTTFQLMTDGNELAHYDFASETKGDVNAPGTLKCKSTLPKHGEFSAEALTKLANPAQLAQAKVNEKIALGSYSLQMQNEDDINRWNTQLKSGKDDFAYRKLVTEEGQTKYQKYFNSDNPMPSIEEVKAAIARQDKHWEPCVDAYTQIESAKGDDVLHLSINVQEAIAEMDRRAGQTTVKNRFNNDSQDQTTRVPQSPLDLIKAKYELLAINQPAKSEHERLVRFKELMFELHPTYFEDDEVCILTLVEQAEKATTYGLTGTTKSRSFDITVDNKVYTYTLSPSSDGKVMKIRRTDDDGQVDILPDMPGLTFADFSSGMVLF